MIRPLLPALLAVLALAGCDDMSDQPRYDSYEPSTLFDDGTSLQAPPEGTVARDGATEDIPRPAMSLALLERGRDRYAIYCVPCHDAAGTGRGTVPARGYPQPPSLHEKRLVDAPSRHFYDVITHGHGVMYSYADRVTPADRWAIAAYIRALQVARHTPVRALSDAERAKLEGAGS